MEMWEEASPNSTDELTALPQSVLTPRTPSGQENGISEGKLRAYFDEIKETSDINVVMEKIFNEIEDDEAFTNTISRIEKVF